MNAFYRAALKSAEKVIANRQERLEAEDKKLRKNPDAWESREKALQSLIQARYVRDAILEAMHDDD